MIRFIKKKMKAFVIYIVRRSAYYQDLNKIFHEIWWNVKLNNYINHARLDKDSLYGKCVDAEKKHERHYT